MIRRLRDLLSTTLVGAGLQSTSDIWSIGDVWEEAVGTAIAAHAAPAGLRRGELLVAAPDAVWRQELSLLAPDIKNKINRRLGREVVERVRIVAGQALGPRPPRLERRATPAAGAAVRRGGDGTPPIDAARSLGEALAGLGRARAAHLARSAERRRAR